MFDFWIFSLKKFDRLKVITAPAVLARFQTFDENRFQRRDDYINANARYVRCDLEAAVLLDRVHAKPRKAIPSSRQPVGRMLLQTLAYRLIYSPADIHNALRIMEEVDANLLTKIDCLSP